MATWGSCLKRCAAAVRAHVRDRSLSLSKPRDGREGGLAARRATSARAMRSRVRTDRGGSAAIKASGTATLTAETTARRGGSGLATARCTAVTGQTEPSREGTEEFPSRTHSKPCLHATIAPADEPSTGCTTAPSRVAGVADADDLGLFEEGPGNCPVRRKGRLGPSRLRHGRGTIAVAVGGLTLWLGFVSAVHSLWRRDALALPSLWQGRESVRENPCSEVRGPAHAEDVVSFDGAARGAETGRDWRHTAC